MPVGCPPFFFTVSPMIEGITPKGCTPSCCPRILKPSSQANFRCCCHAHHLRLQSDPGCQCNNAPSSTSLVSFSNHWDEIAALSFSHIKSDS
jgi:hypothetical protein